MASDVVYRKLNKYEWSESTPVKLVAPQSGEIIKEVLGGALACFEKRAYLCGGYDARTGRSLSQLAEFDFSTKQWSKGPSLPEKIRDAAAVAFGEYCFVFGGWNDENYSKNFWMLAPKSPGNNMASAKEAIISSWKLVQPAGLGPSARVCHAMVLGNMSDEEGTAQNPVLYLFGGFDGEKRLNDVWRLRLSALIEQGVAAWELVEVKGGTPPAPRDDAAVAFDLAGERLLVFGGFASSLQSDLHFLSLRGGKNEWTCQLCVNVPSRRQGCVAAVSNGHLLVCLGEDEKGSLSQVLQLSLTEFKWCMLPFEKDELVGRRGCVGCVGEKGKRIIIFGGGVLPKLHSSLLEFELEKADAGSTRKK
ncbi:hypothetical protein C3747_19g34 [Trypanosoma cruzi]|uniref:Uncharacterized protein n=2 Tax=Trypanosoma cruzi TaxID=5693 RepID=Q4DKC0_TRYCC|nr:hypothetical protein, conserved [Trypanosoma cruzi]EAN92980.1 hypothetical protein, conserved [Trypanosoma cruzi]PWV17118.1 hypothetical protein C3747_19g34 [Trypanosoma cruzi]|eukprot:XP_814831.1 hypothetical protein [Trypanosoma cruzi strain CL Brener]